MIKLPPKYLNDTRKLRKPKSRQESERNGEEMQAIDQRGDLAEALRIQYLKLSEEIKLL